MKGTAGSPLADHCTIQDRVANYLRELVLNGVLRPGDRIDTRLLAEQLGTSTMPVREALHQLEAEEFVVFEPYRGIFVARLSPDRLEEIYIMRAALEEFAVGLAVPRLGPEALAALGSELDVMRRAVESADPHSFYASDRTFHEKICAAAGRPTLLKQVRDLRARCLRYSRLYQGLPGVMAKALAENEDILDACRSGNVALAVQRTRVHILGASHRVVHELRRQRRTGEGSCDGA